MHLWPLRAADSANRKIFRAAMVIAVLTLLAKAVSTVKELIVAARFGRSDALDAFLIAYLLPSFAMILVRAAFESALIPALVGIRQKKGVDAAQELFSNMALLTLLALLALTVVLLILTPYYLPYLASGFAADKLRLTQELLYVLLPLILFSGMAGCASAALNAGEKFALPAFAPLITPLITIVSIVFAARRWGPFSLAVGVAAGSLVEAIVLARALQGQGMSLRLRWTGFNPDVRAASAQFLPMLAGAFLMSSSGLVDQSMAAMLPGGSVAALSYANKIVSVVTTIGATALSTAALPYLSKMVAQNDWNGCRHTLKRYSLLVAATAGPFMFILMAFSKPLVRLLFQRGAFTSVDTELVSSTQICYSVQIPFYVLGALFVRFLSSVRRNDALLYVSAINLVLDIVLNFILMRRWGVAGLAMSTSLVCIVSLLLLITWSVRFLAQRRSPSTTEEGGVVHPHAAG